MILICYHVFSLLYCLIGDMLTCSYVFFRYEMLSFFYLVPCFSPFKYLFYMVMGSYCFLLLDNHSYCFLLLNSCSYFFFPLFLNILKTSHYLIGLLLICFDDYMLLIFNIQSLNNDTTFKNWYLVSYLFLSYLSYCDSY